MAGHEAARLGSQLAASQRQRREREAGMICEPRARSYDHQRQDKPEKSKSLRINKQNNHNYFCRHYLEIYIGYIIKYFYLFKQTIEIESMNLIISLISKCLFISLILI